MGREEEEKACFLYLCERVSRWFPSLSTYDGQQSGPFPAISSLFYVIARGGMVCFTLPNGDGDRKWIDMQGGFFMKEEEEEDLHIAWRRGTWSIEKERRKRRLCLFLPTHLGLVHERLFPAFTFS